MSVAEIASRPAFFDRQEVYESREEWLLARRSGIGASETPTLFGVGYANQSPLSVYESKMSDLPPPPVDARLAKRLRIGKQMEPVLREIFRDEKGMEVVDAGEFAVWRHPIYPFITASLDGLCVDSNGEWCVVELKNVHHFNKADWEAEEPPLKYAVQVQQQLAVTGCDRGFLLGLVGGQDPVVVEIARNDAFIDGALIPMCQGFWDCVERGVLPDVDGSEATKDALKRLYPKDEGEEILLPDEFNAMAEDLESLKETIKKSEERKTFIENKIKAVMGTATYAMLSTGGGFTWKTQKPKDGYWVKPQEVGNRPLLKCK